MGMFALVQKITFAEMRAASVRGVLIYCSDCRCSHSTSLDADRWADDIRLSDIEPGWCVRPAVAMVLKSGRIGDHWSRDPSASAIDEGLDIMATFLKIFVAVLLVVFLAHAVIGWLRPDVMPRLSFLPGDIKYESPSGNVRVYFRLRWCGNRQLWSTCPAVRGPSKQNLQLFAQNLCNRTHGEISR